MVILRPAVDSRNGSFVKSLQFSSQETGTLVIFSSLSKDEVFVALLNYLRIILYLLTENRWTSRPGPLPKCPSMGKMTTDLNL